MQRKKSWSELSPAARAVVAGLGVTQLSLLLAALVDLYRRDSSAVNGRKRVWAAVSFINFIGPISYFIFGRKR